MYRTENDEVWYIFPLRTHELEQIDPPYDPEIRVYKTWGSIYVATRYPVGITYSPGQARALARGLMLAAELSEKVKDEHKRKND